MTSKKELIIKAFSEMNISLLELTLKDDGKYHNSLTKESYSLNKSEILKLKRN